MKRTICLTIAYDGSAYHGFQRQLNALTIQQVLEQKLKRLFGHPLTIHGAARTDAGVHAYGQVISFKTSGTIPVERIPLAARSVLPTDIVVYRAVEAEPEFHARISATSKLYRYQILNQLLPDPLLRKYVWHFRGPLAIEPMQEALQHIIGCHDFSAFRATGGATISPVRRLIKADCRQNGKMIEFNFHGSGFLYHMVRNIVGTLVDIGIGKKRADDMLRILQSGDRGQAGATAPPNGLYLQEVYYN